MSKLRVYELARELNIESRAMVGRLQKLGINVISHQSTLSDSDISKARLALGSKNTEKNGGRSEAPAVVASDLARRPSVVIRRRRAVQEPDEVEGAELAPIDSTPSSHSEDETTAAISAPVSPVVQDPESPSNAEFIEVSDPGRFDADVDHEAPETSLLEAPVSPSSANRSTSGATIVRRASPEEVAAGQAAQETRGRRGGRREDARGTRLADSSSSSERITAVHSIAHQEANLGLPPSVVTEGRRPGKARADDEPDEEAVAAKKLPPKQKRSKLVNTRLLLNQIDDPDVETSEAETDPDASLPGKTVYTPSAPMRRRDLKRRRNLKKTQVTTPRQSYRVVKIDQSITVGDLAKQMSIKAGEIIKKLMAMGEMMTINSPIEYDAAALIAADYQFEVRNTHIKIEDILGAEHREQAQKAKQIERPPIVTVMGHVDHGKTSILDALRHTNVTAKEAGGITQHIGAYMLEYNGRKLTFIDTPGHEAFSTMRARGANATDIVVLVVAADDGVMPQTVEAISHARDAEVPIIVALNKMDKPNINVDRVFTELTEYGIQSEEWGGDTQFVKVSAMAKTGLEDLLEAILLQAEILELKAAIGIPAEGTVVEAHLDKGRGPVATVLVQSGTMRKGDDIVVGTMIGKVRAMIDHFGRQLVEVGPSTRVEVIGLGGVPKAGDQVNVVKDDKTARDAAEWRMARAARELSGKSSAQSLEDLLSRVQSEEKIEVPVIIKGDTQGSVEAVAESILKIPSDKVSNKIVHRGVGGITDSDVALAEASGSVVIGFNVRASSALEDMAERRGIVIRYFSIIYDVTDAMKSIMQGRLPPLQKEVVIGHAEVRDPISVPKIGLIAGSAVTDGKITRASRLRLIRDDVVIFEGRVSSLRRFKDDVQEVASGYECGIALDGCNDIRQGDVVEAYVIEESEATL